MAICNISIESNLCKPNNLVYNRLKEVLDYKPCTGVFMWKKNISQGKAGTIAGTLSNGYIRISVDNVTYMAHRLAWFLVHGYFAENDIDHINRDRSDNRIKNLREISRSCNMRNCGNRKTNKSGVKGVSWDNGKNKWRSEITLFGKKKSLGRYHSFDDAVCARLAGEQCVNWSGCDSESPAYRYVIENITGKSL